jgi:hypothetical protein
VCATDRASARDARCIEMIVLTPRFARDQQVCPLLERRAALLEVVVTIIRVSDRF